MAVRTLSRRSRGGRPSNRVTPLVPVRQGSSCPRPRCIANPRAEDYQPSRTLAARINATTEASTSGS
jgi:hypothetical protein